MRKQDATPLRDPAKVGKKIKALRTLKDMTLAQVAEGSGIDVADLSRLERGRPYSGRLPRIEILDHIAAKLGTTAFELLGDANG